MIKGVKIPQEPEIEVYIGSGKIAVETQFEKGLNFAKGLGFECPKGKKHEKERCFKTCFDCKLCG